MSMRHSNHHYHHHLPPSTSWVIKCTDLPQWDALQAQADMFMTDDKLHLRNLCNDSARCSGLITIHTTTTTTATKGIQGVGEKAIVTAGGAGASSSGTGSTDTPVTGVTGGVTGSTTTGTSMMEQRKLILDYSRQRINGETMELLFDLADAVGLTSRQEALRIGMRVNATEGKPVLHHLLRSPIHSDIRLYEDPGLTLPWNQPQQQQKPQPPLDSTSTGQVRSRQTDIYDSTHHNSHHETTSNSSTMTSTNTNNSESQHSGPGSLTFHHRFPGGGHHHPGGNNIRNNQAISSSTAPFPAFRQATTTQGNNTSATSNNSSNNNGLVQGNRKQNEFWALHQVHEIREKIYYFSKLVRSGSYRSSTNHRFRHFICIGYMGCHIATDCIYHALQADPIASQQVQGGSTIRFLSNVDPIHFHSIIQDLNPMETMIIITSPSFMDADTMLCARTIRKWLIEQIYHKLLSEHESQPHTSNSTTNKNTSTTTSTTTTTTTNIILPTEEEIVAQHMIAITATPSRSGEFGILLENTFPYLPWVSARFSVWSAVGLLPLSLQYSYSIMCQVLNGAHAMDEHFFHAPLRDNIPVIMGLLGVWNSTFLQFGSRVMLPYSHALCKLPNYVQKLDMESNGKRVALDGTSLLHRSGEITFGTTGSEAIQSFTQLMHQGRVIPADFIGFMESQYPIDLVDETASNHDELMSNFFAQPDALAYGKTLLDLVQEGAPEPLREHMVLTGNRPSSSLLFSKLDAYTIGQILALYEHRTTVQGFIWGTNSFDQFGNELGKTLAKQVRAQLSASRKSNALVQGFNVSTSTLLEHYLAHEKYIKERQQQEQKKDQRE